jgi:lysophospholipase L1-like esterase
MRTKRKVFGGFMARQMLAIAVLATPMLAGNDTNYTYLALGDSIAFGFNPLLFSPTLPTPTPSEFIGYPETVGQVVNLQLVNAACPGETSASFWIAGALDNGCLDPGPDGQPPFKTTVGLHTNYTGTQLAFAESQLATNKHINIVTLGIGGNDLLLLEQQCTAAPVPSFAGCVEQYLPGVLQSYGANLTVILKGLRANYGGMLIVVNNYSPSANSLFIEAVQALDQVMTQVGANFGVKFADAFTAFQIASAFYGGDPCAAGLLIRLTPTTCDVHPTPLGRDLLAATVIFSSVVK